MKSKEQIKNEAPIVVIFHLRLLDEGDFMEYKNMIGEWSPPDTCHIKGPPPNNNILGHIIQRLLDLVHPPTPPPPPPEYPPFPIRAAVLGKAFSGKTTCLAKLAEAHRLEILSTDVLIEEAVQVAR